MKYHALLLSLPLLLTVPLVGCGSSTPTTDASNTTATTNGTNTSGVANGVASGSQAVVALPPEAPPMLLPDIPVPPLPAPPRDEVVYSAYGPYITTFAKAYADEWQAYNQSFDKTRDAAVKMDSLTVQAPNFAEPIEALRALQYSLEETDAHTKRMARYMGSIKAQLADMYVSSNLQSSRSHFQKAVSQTETYMAEASKDWASIRDGCHKMRDALSRGDGEEFGRINEQSKQNREKLTLDDGVEEFDLAVQYYKAASSS